MLKTYYSLAVLKALLRIYILYIPDVQVSERDFGES